MGDFLEADELYPALSIPLDSSLCLRAAAHAAAAEKDNHRVPHSFAGFE